MMIYFVEKCTGVLVSILPYSNNLYLQEIMSWVRFNWYGFHVLHEHRWCCRVQVIKVRHMATVYIHKRIGLQIALSKHYSCWLMVWQNQAKLGYLLGRFCEPI